MHGVKVHNTFMEDTENAGRLTGISINPKHYITVSLNIKGNAHGGQSPPHKGHQKRILTTAQVVKENSWTEVLHC
jgi:hypothetical protein